MSAEGEAEGARDGQGEGGPGKGWKSLEKAGTRLTGGQ